MLITEKEDVLAKRGEKEGMKDKTRHNLGLAFMVLGVISLLAGISGWPYLYNLFFHLWTYGRAYRIYIATRALAATICLAMGWLLLERRYLWFKQKGWISVKCTKCGKILRRPNYWPKKTFKPNETIPMRGHLCKVPAAKVTFVAYETEQTPPETP